MIRSLYAKIFLSFSLATLATTAAIFLINVATHSHSLGPSWMTGVLDQYARSAVDIYIHGGKPRLAEYLDKIDDISFLQASLFDPKNRDILGRGVPLGAEEVLAKARATNNTQFHIGLLWTGASVVDGPDGKYILVAKVLIPYRGLVQGALATAVLAWLLPAIAGALLCLFLGYHIAKPVRTLQSVAGKIADGDLSVRACPAIGSRRGKSDAIERMQTDLRRLDALIGQILTLTRLQTRDNQRTEASVSLRAILESVAEDARFEVLQEGKSVVVLRADDCWLKGDPALLRSCVENVVRNAVHYTKPQTEVLLSLDLVRNGRESARILVADRGDGVPLDALDRIFEPFYRVTQAHEHQTGGTGLGLSIAQRIAKVHGGDITARNRDGGGLEMEIRLPVDKLT